MPKAPNTDIVCIMYHISVHPVRHFSREFGSSPKPIQTTIYKKDWVMDEFSDFGLFQKIRHLFMAVVVMKVSFIYAVFLVRKVPTKQL